MLPDVTQCPDNGVYQLLLNIETSVSGSVAVEVIPTPPYYPLPPLPPLSFPLPPLSLPSPSPLPPLSLPSPALLMSMTEVSMQVQNRDGQAYPGFSLADCIPIKGNFIRIPVIWSVSGDYNSDLRKISLHSTAGR